MIGEVPVYWFLMSGGPDLFYGIVAQEGTIYSGTIRSSLRAKVKSGQVCVKPFNFKLDDAEDKKKTIKEVFTKWVTNK